MKVLVTGATGFIGRHVVQRLLRDGHDLLLTTNSDCAPGGGAVQTVPFGDDCGRLDGAAIRAFGPDTLIHLAWAGIPQLDVTWSLTNVAITSRVFASALECGVGRIVGVGSCREYRAGGGSKAENDLPVHHSDVFGQAKTSACDLLRAAGDHCGVEWRWARPFFVYGPGQRAESLIPSAISRAAEGGELTVASPTAAVDFVNVADVADALCLLATRPGPSGAFNVGSGRAHNVASVAAWVRKQWRGEPTGDIMVGSAPEAWWADTTAITNGYGWTPAITLESGIRELIGEARA